MSKKIQDVTPAKSKKKYAPTRLEVIKTVIIAVLITGIVAFIVGVHFANNQYVTVVKTVEAAASVEQDNDTSK